MKRLAFLFFLFLFSKTVDAQSPTPAAAQKQSILILGATAHLGNGQVIPSAAVAFENGKLTMVADQTVIRFDRSKFGKVIDATGKQMWPGFIAMDTKIGLNEVDAARATLDFEETGPLNPNVRAIIAYNADSEVSPTLRSNGVLMAQICPEGGQISGQSSVVQLDAWNWEDAAVRLDEGIHLNWPAPRRFSGFESGNPEMKPNDDYLKQTQAFDQLFAEAKAYAAKPVAEPKNQKLEAMRGLFDGSKKLYLHTETAKTIEESVLFAEKWGCRAVVVGAHDAWLVADFLKKHNAQVVLAKTQNLPARDDEAIDQPFKTPAILAAAGVDFAISHDGTWRTRNLPFQAGQAAAFGLDHEAALTAITLAPARILGIEKTSGSLEIGKDATLFLSSGDALDMRGNKIETAFIQGREIDLDNKQKRLFRKFSIKK